MSKVPLFFMVAVAIIAVAASYRYVQQRREKMDHDAAAGALRANSYFHLRRVRTGRLADKAQGEHEEEIRPNKRFRARA